MGSLESTTSKITDYMNRLDDLTAEEELDFTYDNDTLERFYSVAVFAFGEIEDYIEFQAEKIISTVEDLYNENRNYITFPLFYLAMKKGAEFTTKDKYDNFIGNGGFIEQGIKHYREEVLKKNYGINKKYITTLFIPLGIDDVKEDTFLNAFYSNLDQLSNYRHQAAHHSFEVSKSISHTPKTLKSLLKELILKLADFDNFIQKYIDDSTEYISGYKYYKDIYDHEKESD